MKLLAFTVLALLAASVQASKLSDTLAKIVPSFATGFVINGTEATPHTAPFIVSLSNKYAKHAHICGGTLINKNWVITAAHCISAPVGMSVVAGLHKRVEMGDRTQQRKVNFGRVHEEYTGGVGPYDIALLHVSEPFEFNEWVKPATLPSRVELHKGESHLYGWGQPKSYIFTGSKVLMTMTANIINYEDCKKALPEDAPVAESNICTDSHNKSLSACNGDSGGPLVVERENNAAELIGIVSWGYIPCGYANMPSIYTKVSWYIDWIVKVQSAYYTLF